MFYLFDGAFFGSVLVFLFLCAVSWVALEKRSFDLDTFVCGFGWHLGLWALCFWMFGTAGFLNPALPLIGFLFWWLSRGRRRQHTLQIENLTAKRAPNPIEGSDRLLLFYIAIVCLFTFVLTLAPPSGGEWDSLMYHLAAPQQYLRHGKIVELPYDHHSYFPFTMEMLFLWGLALRGPVLAKLFHWLMLPLCCAALIAIGKRHLSLRVGLLAAALFASIPIVQSEASTAYIDLGLTAFVLLAYLCCANWKTTGEKQWLISCGAFCGFCIGTKYLGVLTFAWLGLWIVGTMARGKKWQIKPLLSATLLALVIGGGWYARNVAWTGNPVYPFAYEVFGGKNWSPEMARLYTEDQKKFGFGRGWEDLLAAPWRVAMTPVNVGVFQKSVGEKPVPYVAGMPWWPTSNLPPVAPHEGLFEVPGLAFSTVIGPALLAFGLPMIFVRRKPWLIGFLGWSFVFYGLFWFATGQYVRYLMPAFALWCLPCGWMADKFLRRSALLKYTAGTALVAWCLFAPLVTGNNARSSFGVIFGQETPDDYLTRTFVPYPAMRWASQNTPKAARFAIYGEPRDYYLDRDYFWADDPHNNLIDYARIHDGADFVKALRSLGATHVFSCDPPSFGGPPLGPMQDAIQRGLLQQLFEARGCRIYKIAAAA